MIAPIEWLGQKWPTATTSIVLFGATGFTGALTAEYLLRNAPGRRRAGRSPAATTSKLAGGPRAARRGSTPAAADLPLLQADVERRRLDRGDRAGGEGRDHHRRPLHPATASRSSPPARRRHRLRRSDRRAGVRRPDVALAITSRHGSRARGSSTRAGSTRSPTTSGRCSRSTSCRRASRSSFRGSASSAATSPAVPSTRRSRRSGPPAARVRRSPASAARASSARPARRVHGRTRNPARRAGGRRLGGAGSAIDPQHVLRSARALDRYGPDFSYSHYLVTGGLAKLAALGLRRRHGAALAQLPFGRDPAAEAEGPGGWAERRAAGEGVLPRPVHRQDRRRAPARDRGQRRRPGVRRDLEDARRVGAVPRARRAPRALRPADDRPSRWDNR